jgi:ferredoxin
MIIVKRKPIDELRDKLSRYKNIAVFGCGTCASVCLEGGEKEAKEICGLLTLSYKKEGLDIKVRYESATRLCEEEFVRELRVKFSDVDAVLSLGCGAGIQLVSDIFKKVNVYPGVNTQFVGTNDSLGEFSEKCASCGDCILDKTGGICPIARCSKNILNGPCGGSENGKCEINPDIDCAWQLIYDRMNELGRLEELEEIIPPKNWKTSRDGGPRKMKKNEVIVKDE